MASATIDHQAQYLAFKAHSQKYQHQTYSYSYSSPERAMYQSFKEKSRLYRRDPPKFELDLNLRTHEAIQARLKALPVDQIKVSLQKLHAQLDQNPKNYDALQRQFTQIQGKIREINAVERAAKIFKAKCKAAMIQARSAKEEIKKQLGIGVPQSEWSEQEIGKQSVFLYERRVRFFKKNAAIVSTKCQSESHSFNLFKQKVNTCPNCKKGVCNSCATKVNSLVFCAPCSKAFHSLQNQALNHPQYSFYAKTFNALEHQLSCLEEAERIALAVWERYNKLQALMTKADEIRTLSLEFKSKSNKLKRSFAPYYAENTGIALGCTLTGVGVVTLRPTLIVIGGAVGLSSLGFKTARQKWSSKGLAGKMKAIKTILID